VSDAANGQDSEREPVTGTEIDSTTGYLKLVFLNPISAVGIVIAVAGILLISLSTPSGGGPPRPPLFAAGLMLFGVVFFALGYTRAQRAIKRDESRRGDE
jgi:drug/metabolite transporter (DMT)-like permease